MQWILLLNLRDRSGGVTHSIPLLQQSSNNIQGVSQGKTSLITNGSHTTTVLVDITQRAEVNQPLEQNYQVLDPNNIMIGMHVVPLSKNN
jgi:hypothetical protein